MTRFVVDFEPLLSWSIIAGLGGLLALLGLYALIRRLPGAWLRLLAAALLVAALVNPVLQREEREPLPAVVALIVDESGSQGIGERSQQTEAAVAALKDRIAALSGFETREVRVGDAANDGGTALFGALAEALDDVPPDRLGGAVMVTDGIVHDTPAEPESLQLGAPLHALITGEEEEYDRRIVLEKAPRFAILGEEQGVTYRVVDDRLGPGRSLAVTLRIDGKEVATDIAIVGEAETIELPIDHAGRAIVELEVEAAEGEITTDNNVAVAEIDVVREHLRVLLVSGEPHAGERTWRNVLKSDAAVDLVHFTILRPPEKQDGTPIHELSLIAFPTRELFSEKIDEFDLIIFDRYQRRGVLPILYFDNIARYVRDGGAVLIAAGPDYASPASLYRTPLGTVLPAEPSGEVREEPYRPAVTELGAKHPVTRDLPGAQSQPPDWSRWFRLVDADALRGDVPLEGPGGRPLLVLSHEDRGRIAMLLSDHAWLWARGFEGGGPHGALLRRIVHWLMGEPELEEEALTVEAEGNSLAVERQTLGESAPTITATGPNGEAQEVPMREARPGLWRGRLENADLGLYKVSDGRMTTLAHIGTADPLEFREVTSTRDRLAPVAEASGGAAIRLASDGAAIPRVAAVSRRAAAAGSGWIGLKRSEATILKGVDRLPLFGGLLGLALLVGAFAALWWREGR
ncbi:membrane protein [Afifella pfennigii]|uniref:membrane protein n=1 Tax=Afifella pfennigii TaxID=209897 RepID=UPI00047D53DE|nr:membrane protein [Afifella pfennigii]